MPTPKTPKVINTIRHLLLAVSLSLTITLSQKTTAQELIDTIKLERDAGNLSKAQERLQSQLSNKDTLSTSQRWQALIALSWIYQVRGSFKESVETLNEALDIASKLNNTYLLGRTLSYLGWSFSAMGRYEAAVTFYKEALRLSTNDAGKPTMAMIWGLSQQELGTLYVKMGKAEEGKALVQQTTQFARSNGILSGVAEGAIRLAEFALLEGGTTEAAALAKEAVAAATLCNCSSFNTAQALLIEAKAHWFAVKETPGSSWQNVRQEFEAALDVAKKSKATPIIAEALLLLSATHPHDTAKRLSYLEEALTLMNKGEYELRAKAASELGRVYFDQHADDLAKFYLRHSITINSAMLREVDRSQELGDKALLEHLAGDIQKEVSLLNESALKAMELQHPEEALKSYERLIALYAERHYTRHAAEAAQQALKSVEALLDSAPDTERKAALEKKNADLKEIVGIAQVQGAI